MLTWANAELKAKRTQAHCFQLSWTDLRLGGVFLVDQGPVFSIQTVSHLELLHEDILVIVFPTLNHHAGDQLVQAQVHLTK